MATTSRTTLDEFLALDEGDRRLELVDGRVVETGPPGALHGHILALIAARIADHVARSGGGVVLAGDVSFVLGRRGDPHRVRAPDISYVSYGRVARGALPAGPIHGAPDLAVEVLSPHDNPVDVQQKVRDFLEAGTLLVWIVAPRARTVTVYRPDGSARLLRDDEAINGEQVLPGLAIPLDGIWLSD